MIPGSALGACEATRPAPGEVRTVAHPVMPRRTDMNFTARKRRLMHPRREWISPCAPRAGSIVQIRRPPELSVLANAALCAVSGNRAVTPGIVKEAQDQAMAVPVFCSYRK